MRYTTADATIQILALCPLQQLNSLLNNEIIKLQSYAFVFLVIRLFKWIFLRGPLFYRLNSAKYMRKLFSKFSRLLPWYSTWNLPKAVTYYDLALRSNDMTKVLSYKWRPRYFDIYSSFSLTHVCRYDASRKHFFSGNCENICIAYLSVPENFYGKRKLFQKNLQKVFFFRKTNSLNHLLLFQQASKESR